MPATREKTDETSRAQRRARPTGRSGAAGPEDDPREGLTVTLYQADGTDRAVRLTAQRLSRLGDKDLLWVDVDADKAGAELNDVASVLHLPDGTLLVPDDDRSTAARVRESEDFFAVGIAAIRADGDDWQSVRLLSVVGRNWLVTAHHGDVDWLTEFRDHVNGESKLGRLEAAAFLAHLLEWMLNSYYEAIDSLQTQVDEIEDGILRDEVQDDAVRRLVSLRRRLGDLRSRLAPHRRAFATLSHPSFDVLAATESSADFQLLNERLELAVQAVDTTREMIVGALDLYMTQTAQHTNDIMKVLTTVSVLLLPIGAIAGIMGMNMLPDYVVQSWVFYAVLVLMAVVSAAAVLFMRRRHWL